ncbi:hypothetical protein HY641_02180 [Candidatus Woesearchaeota archaeon]|nr:hypothetical protein [Candidatus Woesearchaeota archaeon]
MKYVSLTGEVYDLGPLSQKEHKLIEWLRHEYDVARSWIAFHDRTSHGIIAAARCLNPDHWQEHLLYKIQLDLTGNKGIELGELRGSISQMFIDAE